MSSMITTPYDHYILSNGKEIKFGIASSSNNGWWRFNEAKMGRGYEGEQSARKMLWRNTVRQLEHYDWPIPVSVGNKPYAPYVRGGFAVTYDHLLGSITTGVSINYNTNPINFLVMNVPPGIWWHLEKPSADDDGKYFSYKEYTAKIENLDEYVANPVKHLVDAFPWVNQFLPEEAHTTSWLEKLTKSTNTPQTEGKLTWHVTAQDVVRLRGGYKSIAEKTLKSAEELFEALRATGIRISTRATGHGAERALESLNIYIPPNLAKVDTANRNGLLEVHAEPHTIDISLSGVSVRCGYVESEQKMEEYNKLEAAKELAGLARMFDSDTSTTEEVVETYEW